MDELFCPHFWGQVVLPQLQALVPFVGMWWGTLVTFARRVSSLFSW
jgi:hypothetical protein